MSNLDIYNKVREVPKEAQKQIGGGRLKGMTDINPMWRIKCLTEQFGACGFGWYYVIKEKWIETCMAKDEITANVKIELFYKVDDTWSMPVEGIGGSMLVASEKSGLYVNDECYKMALTDAISVACKALGMGADIYWGNDNTKYNDKKKDNAEPQKKAKSSLDDKPKAELIERLVSKCDEKRYRVSDICDKSGVNSTDDLTVEQLKKWIDWLEAK